MERRGVSTPKDLNSERHFFLPHDNGPLPADCVNPQYKAVNLPHKFCLRTRMNDNTCILADGTIIRIQNFAFCSASGQAQVIGKQFRETADLYTYPSASSMLGIVLASDLSGTSSWPLSSIVQKCVRIPFKGKHAIFPLVHLQ